MANQSVDDHVSGFLFIGRRFVIGIGVLALVGCAAVQEESIYPDGTAVLTQVSYSAVSEQAVQANIRQPAATVWEALLTVLNQHAFISHINGHNNEHLELSYTDITTLLLEGVPTPISLPFTVVVEPEEYESTLVTVYPRWDLITNEIYREKRADRFNDLVEGMETEAAVLMQRTLTQALGGTSWNWMTRVEASDE